MAVAILVAWSVAAQESAVIPLVAIGTGMVLLLLLRRRVKEIMIDERTHRISERACRMTVGIFAPLIAVTAVTLIMLSKRVLPDVRQAGFALAYSACAMMVLYDIFYLYYERKH